MKITLRQILIVIAVLAVIVVNSLANIIPFNGQTTGQVSENLSNYFVPAGYVFSIWGLIYLGLVAYAIFQVRPVETNNPRLKAIGGWFLLSSAANIVWLLLWHYNQFILTVPVMLVLLFSLIKIYLTLHNGNPQISTGERWAVRIPFSIYLGWITVATIANISATLVSLNWNGLGIAPTTWFLVVLVAAILISALMAYFRRDIAYLLVPVWAFVGIALRPTDSSLVVTASWVAAGFVLVLVIFSLVKPRPAV
jgi:benzodiazapine receptor